MTTIKSTMLTTGWFASIYLLLCNTIPLVNAQQCGTSSISGYAFFDSSSDGIKDPSNTLDYGIYDISVWLFNCKDKILKTTKTDTSGYYSFDGINSMSLDTDPFGYYIYTHLYLNGMLLLIYGMVHKILQVENCYIQMLIVQLIQTQDVRIVSRWVMMKMLLLILV